jgi:hypothetical protein
MYTHIPYSWQRRNHVHTYIDISIHNGTFYIEHALAMPYNVYGSRHGVNVHDEGRDLGAEETVDVVQEHLPAVVEHANIAMHVDTYMQTYVLT